jgi:ketosteroid isomerase-like protein
MTITQSDTIAIRETIEQQLAAFQKDDTAGAFALASPEIQLQFTNPENFMQMVRLGYPAVYRPRSVVFEKITSIHGKITQLVLLLGPDGVPFRALYLMEKQRDTTWRINGCVLIPVDSEI